MARSIQDALNSAKPIKPKVSVRRSDRTRGGKTMVSKRIKKASEPVVINESPMDIPEAVPQKLTRIDINGGVRFMMPLDCRKLGSSNDPFFRHVEIVDGRKVEVNIIGSVGSLSSIISQPIVGHCWVCDNDSSDLPMRINIRIPRQKIKPMTELTFSDDKPSNDSNLFWIRVTPDAPECLVFTDMNDHEDRLAA